MAYEVQMPKWGLTMKTGKIARWLVAEGGAVAVGQPLLEVETDKITNVVESPAGGVLLQIVSPQGEVVPVMQVIGIIGESGEAVAALLPRLPGQCLPIPRRPQHPEPRGRMRRPARRKEKSAQCLRPARPPKSLALIWQRLRAQAAMALLQKRMFAPLTKPPQNLRLRPAQPRRNHAPPLMLMRTKSSPWTACASS